MDRTVGYELVAWTPHFLAQLWSELWPRGETELGWLGYTMSEGFMLFMQHLRNAEVSGILLRGDKPVFVGGIVREKNESFTFMQATKDFDSHARPIMRVLREKVRTYPPGPLHVYSVCVHPGTERFFRAIGFEREDWKQMLPTGHPLYRFKRR